MYEVHVLAEEFRNVRTVLQHRMVNEVQQFVINRNNNVVILIIRWHNW